MHLDRYVDDIARQMAVAAAAGGPEAEALAERLVLPLRSAVRLALLEALSAAADELTLELAPGSVEVRLRGGEPSFVIDGVAATEPASVPDSAPSHATAEDAIAAEIDAAMRTFAAQDVQSTAIADEGGSARINLRMPDTLKSRVEAAALREGRSVNSWLVRAAAAALEPRGAHPPQRSQPPRRPPRLQARHRLGAVNERNTMKTFPTPTPIAITVEANFAEVQIVASDRSDTVVDVRPTDPDDHAHVQVAEATRVELLGDQLRVIAPKPSLMARILNSPSLDIVISLPRGSAVRADLGAGNVEATGTLGQCTVRTGAGNIRLGDTGSSRRAQRHRRHRRRQRHR